MFPGELIPLTVPEVRRLLCRLLWLPRGSPTLTIQWSGWRRRHQARAMQCHYRRRFLGPLHRMLREAIAEEGRKQFRGRLRSEGVGD